MTAALQALLERVEAGDSRLAILDAAGKWAHAYGNVGLYLYVTDAHFGSLDAAKALMGAVLPGWGYAVSADYFTGMRRSQARVSHLGLKYSAYIDDHSEIDRSARVLLICILRALIATPADTEGR